LEPARERLHIDMKQPVIALITDFGLHDIYVGVMKGVILSINPDARIVDVTHSVPRHDVGAGALALSASVRFFPEGTVFVVVVDPGVGGGREVICAKSGGRYFLAPDSGVLGPVLDEKGYDTLVRLENEDLYLKPVSSTFHGRDIFAPVAAHLSAGFDIKKLGPGTSEYVSVEVPEAEIGPARVVAGVTWVDGFGNLVTNCAASTVRDVVSAWAGITIEGSGESIALVASYDAVPAGALLAIVGSSGYLEISVREGSAAEKLGFEPGDSVVLIEREAE
jgi:S-adenosylmethionine hydrolase